MTTEPRQPDQRLRPYATDRQWEYFEAVAQHGTNQAAAEALNIDLRGMMRAMAKVKKRAGQAGWCPERDLIHEAAEGFTVKGTSILYDGDGNIQGYWNKTKQEGRDPDEAVHLPDPKAITKVSTMYDQQGRVTAQWVAEKPQELAKAALWEQCAAALASGLPRAEPVPAPDHGSADLLAAYPVGDHHLGMLSWDKETGENYDLTIGENLLAGAINYLVDAAPACEQALIAVLGDFMHYDSFAAVTPTSRNLLDADSRYPKMVRAALRSLRHLIQVALTRHQRVHIIIEIGNHDLSSSIFLMECLHNIYENEPRVTVDTSPAHYHYFDFGSVLIGTHHGHGTKMANLPLIMAHDRPEMWGRTKHRYWWTGHIHQRKSSSVVEQSHDGAGCSVESFRVLAPTDAWAAQKGYRPIRDMKAIILHREFGEVARHTVNPGMFEVAA